MSARYHGIVWIDPRQANVFQISTTEESKITINSHVSVQRLHHQNAAMNPHPVDTQFFGRIVAALNHTGGTLIAGPGEAKFELNRYLKRHRPDLDAQVYGADTPDPPGDAGLVALAREYFQMAA